VLAHLKHTKSISLATAQRWLEKMGYHWKRNHKGQYVDGHEQPDVINYQQSIFLPAMEQYEQQMQTWVDKHGWKLPCEINHAIVIWVYDESIFYAHNH